MKENTSEEIIEKNFKVYEECDHNLYEIIDHSSDIHDLSSNRPTLPFSKRMMAEISKVFISMN